MIKRPKKRLDIVPMDVNYRLISITYCDLNNVTYWSNIDIDNHYWFWTKQTKMPYNFKHANKS